MNLNQEIGKYKILEKVGAGGMSEVYLALDSQLHRRVILKFLSDELSHDEEFLKRFKQEARSASALNHPNIITIYEISRHEDQWFIATEYIEGQTLREILKTSPLATGDSLKIAGQVAAALSAAHRAGLIHRDIKPENIMMRDDGLVKVLDFGLVKIVDNKKKTTETENTTRLHTSAGMVLGTLAYMSPEQARGLPVDERTDIWSLGVVLYEMITRHSPFAGETTSDVIAAILRTENDSLNDFNEDCPPEIRQAIFKALEKNRDNRYQNVKDFQIDLKALERQFEAGEEADLSFPTKILSLKPDEDEQATKILHAQPTSGFKYFIGEINERKRWAFPGLALLLVLSAGIGSWFYFRQTFVGSGDAQIASIAVIPFANVGGNSETEYLSDGIAESLINSLSTLPDLTVKARSSVFSYKGKEVAPQQIGTDLSVQAILTGRVFQRGESLSVSLELVDTKTGNHLWGETYNRRADNIIVLQNDIAREVSDKLRKRLSSTDAPRQSANRINDSGAYQTYLKGRYYLNKRTPEDFNKAVESFRQAIDREPNYALAYAGLSDCYMEMTYWAVGLPKELMPKAKAAAQKALELDETLAESHAALATVAEDYDWNFAEAEREYLRAIELNPNNANAFDDYGGFLCEQKRFDEGLAKLEKAAELDPLSPGVEMSKGACLYEARRYDEAIAQMQKILRNNPNYLPASSLLGAIYLRKGMYDQTVEAWLKNSPLENYSPEDIALWKKSYETSGIKGFLRQDIEFRKEAVKKGSNQTLFIAMQYANLGENEEALDWLDQAFEERHSWLGELAVEPAWDNLRGNPRFQDIIRRVGFTE